MIRYMFNKMLLNMQNRYDYDVGYMQDILQIDLKAFFKYMGFLGMSSHTGNLPAAPMYAAKLRAIIWDDCGPCTQLVVDMALEAKVPEEIVQAIVDRDLYKLPQEVALVARFTELVLAHDPEADDLREKILGLWGEQGLITIAYSISSSRVYPALKYAMGYGKACSRVQVNEMSMVPNRQSTLTMGAEHV